MPPSSSSRLDSNNELITLTRHVAVVVVKGRHCGGRTSHRESTPEWALSRTLIKSDGGRDAQHHCYQHDWPSSPRMQLPMRVVTAKRRDMPTAFLTWSRLDGSCERRRVKAVEKWMRVDRTRSSTISTTISLFRTGQETTSMIRSYKHQKLVPFCYNSLTRLHSMLCITENTSFAHLHNICFICLF